MNKIFITLLLAILILTISITAKSQVLISLLLGDKLNTGKIEFGMDGGVNWLNMTNTDNAKQLFDWNLGFYFDFKMNPKLFIHTGVLVKSKMGTTGLDPYSLGNDTLDAVLSGGTVSRKINYFNVPIMLRYRFVDYLHIEGGMQFGLRYGAFDSFYQDIEDEEDLQYQHNIEPDIARLDAGALVGIGYKLAKGEGMTLSVRYYYGFVDVNQLDPGKQANTALYLCAALPIGKKKAEKSRAEKEAGMEPNK